ncbi:MAG: DUF4340 domain-containing protein [Acidobacteria bacterium]|nr:DUF4340 domain-containing protein [Acidobacteriota bacterium]
MHGLKSMVLLLVVLGGLGGYIYFVDSKRDPAAESANAKAFTDLVADNIEEIEIKNASGETAHVQRVGTDWQLVAPDKADADDGIVGTVTSNLSSLEVQRVVDENPSDLAQFGLNPPRIDVAFRVKDQKDFQRLLVGEKTPTGGDFFAKRPGDNRVFLISSFLDSIFNKTAFDLRDKAVLKFDRNEAKSIEIIAGNNSKQFTGNGNDWRIEKPISARADYAGVEGFLSRLSSTFMQKIVVSETSDLKQYGLDQPALTATVTAGSAKSTLIIGRTEEGTSRFAKDVSRNEIFTVDEMLFTELSKDAAEFRRKDLFDGRSFTANRVELKRGDETVALDKTTVDGKETWKNAAGQNVDLMKVEQLIGLLSSVRATAFEPTAHPSLKMPVLTATIRFDDSKKMETVTFGRAATDAFASRADEPGSAKIDAMALDESLKALDGLK